MGRFADGDVLGRTEDYAVRALSLFRYLRTLRKDEAAIMGRQYFRAATSIGANLVEADVAETRRDFIHKCGIALKEARECCYWLRLLLRSELVPHERLQLLINETMQLISILVAIIVKAKRHQPAKSEV